MEKVTPIDEEYIYEGKVMISQTDLDGTITYTNRMFSEVSAYKIDELQGKSHNIIRHPDMPSALFEKMWATIKDGQAWNGLIKNLRKDGLFYWVDTEILPIIDDDDSVTGYIAVRKPASKKDIAENSEIYSKMLKIQQ